MLAIGVLGAALTAYLSWTSLSGGQAAGCSAGGGCDVVLSSQWATLLGLPTALWGLLAYVTLGAIAFVRRVDRHWSYAFTVAFFGVCFSVYLTVLELFVIDAICQWCVASAILMTVLFAVSTLRMLGYVGKEP